MKNKVIGFLLIIIGLGLIDINRGTGIYECFLDIVGLRSIFSGYDFIQGA